MSEALLPMPEIETERLILRSWKRSDAPAIATIFADEDNARYIGGTKSDWQAWRHFATIIGHFHLRGYTAFAVEEKSTGKCIGYVGPWYRRLGRTGDWIHFGARCSRQRLRDRSRDCFAEIRV